MKKVIFIVLCLVFVQQNFAQKKLPQGWDEVILDDKPAYMSLITGEVTTTFPTKPSLEPRKVVEYDPTIAHTVQKGETLSSIARKYNKSLAEIYRLNNVEDFDTLEIGEDIVVGYENSASNNSVEVNHSGNTYVVKAGDTLYNISKRYNTSVAQLKTLNNLSSNTISIGQELVVQ